MVTRFNGVKVFSATMFPERERLPALVDGICTADHSMMEGKWLGMVLIRRVAAVIAREARARRSTALRGHAV